MSSAVRQRLFLIISETRDDETMLKDSSGVEAITSKASGWRRRSAGQPEHRFQFLRSHSDPSLVLRNVSGFIR
jgi:hypothetical protein